MDNTFATPINCNPFKWGADIVTHSTTKYMDGHAMCVGGAIVDSGNFDWSLYPDKFRTVHAGRVLSRHRLYGKIRKEGVYHQGDLPADAGSWLHSSPPMKRLSSEHRTGNPASADAQTLRKRPEGGAVLENHEKVAWVNYPGLKSSKYYELARKYMPNGTCGVISFGLKAEEARRRA